MDDDQDSETPDSAAGEAAEGASETPPPRQEKKAVRSENDAMYDVPVELSAVLGTAQIQVSQLLKMGRGAVLELDRKVGDPIDILVNNRMVARGDVVVVEDRLGVTLIETMKPESFD